MPTLRSSGTERQWRKRYRAEMRLKTLCLGALGLVIVFLVVFFTTLIAKGYTAFLQARIQTEVTYSKRSVKLPLAAVTSEVRPLISRGWLRLLPGRVEGNPKLLGTTQTEWVLATSEVDQYLKGRHSDLSAEARETVDQLAASDRAELAFNTGFFTHGDSKLPELAGIRGAFIGSVYIILLTLIFSFPIGIMTSIYLEEFAPDNRLTQAIEININNLAAVPSILFGLLGLAIFINFFGIPRSSALAGGATLALMTLPIIIISTRAALRAVPDSIREGAFSVGASPWQVVWHHTLPLSLPGILTGTIIGIAQAMGETAPLLMIGMMAFIPQAPSGITDAATALPAQIYTWAGEPLRAYTARTAAAILVLLVLILTMNAIAIWLRRRYERRW